MALLKTQVTVKDSPDAVDLVLREDDVVKRKVGRVAFNNVTFRYATSKGNESGGLKNISFSVEPGKMVAFVGASGAGKR